MKRETITNSILIASACLALLAGLWLASNDGSEITPGALLFFSAGLTILATLGRRALKNIGEKRALHISNS